MAAPKAQPRGACEPTASDLAALEAAFGSTTLLDPAFPPASVLLVDTAEAAAAALPLLTSASLAALDAEWKPLADGRGKVPRADLVQVALRLGGDEATTVTLLVDLVSLPPATAAALLRALLANAGCVIVGYGLCGDLAAISWVVGQEAAHAARARPAFLELRRAHAALRSSGGGGGKAESGAHRHHHHATSRRAAKAAGVDADAVAGRGLAGLVCAATGVSLPKGPASPQLSDWGARPLSAVQVAYAAGDVVAVLGVLDALVRVAHGGAGAEQLASLEAAATRLGGEEAAHTPAAAAAAAAAAAWAAPLTADHAHQAPRRRVAALPPPRPWPPGEPPAFICDEALEGLARQLRLAGIDAASCPKAAAVAAVVGNQRATAAARADARAAQARALVAAAAPAPGRPHRVLLTPDAGLARAAEGTTGVAAHLLTTTGRHAQLEAVLRDFQLGPVRRGALLSRCTACNGVLLPTRFETRAGLPRAAAHPPAECGPFWCCGSCWQVYWMGGQYDRAVSGLSARLAAAGVLADVEGGEGGGR